MADQFGARNENKSVKALSANIASLAVIFAQVKFSTSFFVFFLAKLTYFRDFRAIFEFWHREHLLERCKDILPQYGKTSLKFFQSQLF